MTLSFVCLPSPCPTNSRWSPIAPALEWDIRQSVSASGDGGGQTLQKSATRRRVSSIFTILPSSSKFLCETPIERSRIGDLSFRMRPSRTASVRVRVRQVVPALLMGEAMAS